LNFSIDWSWYKYIIHVRSKNHLALEGNQLFLLGYFDVLIMEMNVVMKILELGEQSAIPIVAVAAVIGRMSQTKTYIVTENHSEIA
jgi:hypothetical protein